MGEINIEIPAEMFGDDDISVTMREAILEQVSEYFRDRLRETLDKETYAGRDCVGLVLHLDIGTEIQEIDSLDE